LYGDNLDFTNGGATNVKIKATENVLTISGTSDAAVTITNLKDPVATTDAANKAYVDGVSQGLDGKDSVRVATATAGNWSTNAVDGASIDGVQVFAGERVLLKDETSATDNGIYVIEASGPPVRSSDLATGATAAGCFTFVEAGSTWAATGWLCTADGSVGSGSLVFTQFSGTGAIVAGVNISKTGDTLDVIAAPVFTGAATVGSLVVTSGSVVGNGTIDFGSEDLTTAGVASATQFTATSDARLKQNVVVIEGALAIVEQLRGVRFEWNDESKRASVGPQVGVIAQEMELVLPEVVRTSSCGTKSVDYDKLTAVLIEAVKALAAEVKGLR
jgi:hypothetical protein